MQSKKALEQYLTEVSDLTTKNLRGRHLKAEEQIERLLGQKFYNPFDVLLLQAEASEAEIDKQYRNFALLLHPDRNKDFRSKEAFQMCEKAVKTLRDPEKRAVYVRVMKEGWERASYEREKENKRRLKNGLQKLPQDSFDAEYRKTYLKLFQELDQRRRHMERAEDNNFKSKVEDQERVRAMEQYRILTEEEWEKTREERVANWRRFQKGRALVGSKKSDGGIRAPAYKPEQVE